LPDLQQPLERGEGFWQLLVLHWGGLLEGHDLALDQAQAIYRIKHNVTCIIRAGMVCDDLCRASNLSQNS